MDESIQFDGSPETFVRYYADDDELIRYLWRYDQQRPQQGSLKIIHAPSHWDDRGFAPEDENRTGEQAFYRVLNEAYTKFHVFWVMFIATRAIQNS